MGMKKLDNEAIINNKASFFCPKCTLEAYCDKFKIIINMAECID